eukprot:CAMPEP_0119433642 /NCGR_PEP_ID=MMETSP1335-20130426/49960_1 /TAXON_ID=259385 /ORGANISM="Chrysoculter rhomboideus, Strain RCC1486" /LENGTH=183 /DNA_ID=CAMNT_0007459487 /DNA_START=946 /DNA_END=1495 /DNA_ORIENTATION=-
MTDEQSASSRLSSTPPIGRCSHDSLLAEDGEARADSLADARTHELVHNLREGLVRCELLHDVRHELRERDEERLLHSERLREREHPRLHEPLHLRVAKEEAVHDNQAEKTVYDTSMKHHASTRFVRVDSLYLAQRSARKRRLYSASLRLRYHASSSAKSIRPLRERSSCFMSRASCSLSIGSP